MEKVDYEKNVERMRRINSETTQKILPPCAKSLAKPYGRSGT